LNPRFIKHEETELRQVRQILVSASWQWVVGGLLVTVLYIVFQGLMYIAAFAAVGSRITLGESVILFLKRNFISVFLPAGGISSLAFFTSPLEKRGVNKSQIHFASSIYAFIGILSVVAVAIPAFLWAISAGNVGWGEWAALLTITSICVVVYLVYQSLSREGKAQTLLLRIAPSAEIYLTNFRNNSIRRTDFIICILYSIIIEIIGIAHVYIAMVALGLEPSLPAAVMGYLIAVIFLIVSPFLRGFGAIEVSMAYILIRFGYTDTAAISTTFLFRFFEFWVPLFTGAASFLVKVNKLFMRIFPALFLFLLGIINIVSVLTPVISQRLNWILNFLPMGAVTVSNYFVLLTGLFLLVTAAFMLKGLKTAWFFAMGLSLLSLVGNLTKAGDYEEALFAVVVVLILISSRREYYVKNNPRLGVIDIPTILLSCGAVIVYGWLGFYFLDQKHFRANFGFFESLHYSVLNFFLIGSDTLTPQNIFAQNFVYSINIGGLFCLSFLVYVLVRPYVIRATSGKEDLEWAKLQLTAYGNSSLDYFKTYSDKLIYRFTEIDGFVSYRISGNYAVVLECPVCSSVHLAVGIKEFDIYCKQSGLKSIYFRVPEEKLTAFGTKKKLFLGQEGVLDLVGFSLDGGDRSSIRNALKKVTKSNFHAQIYTPPISDGILQRLKSVSDEWLTTTERTEIVFSQGMFDWDELKQQTIITVENQEEKVVAFLNIIPDYTKSVGNYDLIRKTADAPNGVVDFIMVQLFNHLKEKGYTAVNLGFAPLSGNADPRSFPERSMKFAYEKIRSFSHYKGLRASKEKFSPKWYNKYLMYDQDYDLFTIPKVLSNVIKP
jgi:phosphatidylglycerol lysyltransferase